MYNYLDYSALEAIMLEASGKAAPLVAKAAKRVRAMDKHDGYSMADLEVDVALRTVISALDCAINTNDWDCVGDAFVMIQQIEKRIREGS